MFGYKSPRSSKTLLVGALLVVSGVYAAPKAKAAAETWGKYDLQLRMKKGQEFVYVTEINRDKPKMAGKITTRMRIADVTNEGWVKTDCEVTRVELSGKDKTAEYKRLIAKNPVAKIEFNSKSRLGPHTYTTLTPKGDKKVLELVLAGGVTGSSFSYDPVEVGEEWVGMCIIGDKCVIADWKLVDVKWRVAKLEVTSSWIGGKTLLAPVRITLDLRHGYPTEVAYSLRDEKTGAITRYHQTLDKTSKL
jgi:hypothetical protein